MKTSTKWILGIGLALILVCSIALVSAYLVNRWMGMDGVIGVRTGRLWEDDRFMPHPDLPLRPFHQLPGQKVYSNFPFGIIGLPVLGLGTLFLIGFGVIIALLLTRHPSQPTVATPPPTTSSLSGQVVIPGPTHNCSNCEKEVQDDWKLCPYCGNDLSEGEESEDSNTES